MGTHPIFESDFDCLTVFEIGSKRTETAQEMSSNSSTVAATGPNSQKRRPHNNPPKREQSKESAEIDDDLIWTPIGLFSKSEHLKRRSSIATTSTSPPLCSQQRASVCQGFLDTDSIKALEALRSKSIEE